MKKILLMTLALAGLAGGGMAQVDTTSLSAYYPFNGDVNDASVNACNGINVNISFTTDRFAHGNRACYFSGDSSFIKLTLSETLKVYDNDFTVSAWVYGKDYTGDRTILGTDNSATTNENFALLVRNGRPLLSFMNNDTYAKTATLLDTAQWYNIVYRYIKGTGEQSIFINGVLDTSDTGHSAYIGKDTINIAKYMGANYFNGKLDDIKIYARALTDIEIAALYTEVTSIAQPQLISPQDDSLFTINTPTFLWHSVDSAISYCLQISPYSSFSSLNIDTIINDTTFTPPTLTNDWYFWRVKAYSSLDSSEWSETRLFSISTTTIDIPSLVFPPADTATNDSFPNFDWSDVAGATQYQLQVGKGHRWAYVANASNGLEIYNISDTANVYQISPYSGSGIWCNKMTLQDTLMPIACYSTVKLYNVADPRNPVLLSNTAVNNLCALIRGSYMYVGDQNYGLWVYDISNPASPSVVARFDSTNRVRDLAIVGNIAYLIGDAALKSVNITDPLNPTLIGSLAVSGDDMVLSGNYCYLTNGGSLTVVDISNPASPVQVGFMNTGPGNYQQLAVKGNFAYIGAGYDGVRVVNISNPAGPFQVALYDTTEYGYDFSLVAVSGDYLITGGEYSGSFLLNISDPYNPRAVNHMAGGSRIYAVAMADSFSAMEYDTLVAASACQSDTFLGDGNHYWRARAGAGTWGDYSAARRFTMDTQPPAKTSHVIPNPGQLINDPTPALDYSDISDAYRYQIQVCRDSAFAVLELDTLVSAGGCTLQTALGDGRHWWHVRARDLAGNWALWSDSSYFRLDTQVPGAPTSITANGANPSLWTKNNSFNVSFTQPFDSSGIQYYYYTYGSAPSSNYDTTGDGIHSTTLPIIISVQNIGVTPFYVWARDNAGNLDYHNNAMVDLRYDTIPPSGAIARSNEFSRTTNFTVSWNDGTDQGGSGLKDFYYIKMKVNSGAWNDLNSYYAGNSYVHSGVQGSKYYFEVAALDSAGNTEAFASAAECSTLVDNTITCPILVSPYNGAVRSSASNIFLWQRATAQAGSRLQCSYNSTFTALAKDTLLAADSSGTLALGDSLYYWRVRGQNSPTDTSGWSPARTLRIDTQAPAAPALATPGNDSLTNDNTPLFSWSAVAGAVSYQLIISPDSLFGSLAVDETIDTTAYTIQTVLPDSAYYWKVRAGDAAGNWSPYSARRKFTVDTKAPAVPVAVAPADNANLTTNLPQFIWRASAQAIRYQLQVANNPSFSPLETDTALADTSAVPVWGVNDGTHYWRVRCRDLAGNWSAYSNYRTLSIAGILQVALITPDTAQVWQPGQSIWIQFTKPLYTGYIDTVHVKVRGRHTSIIRQSLTWQAASRTLLISPDSTFAANDTITVFLHGTLRDSANVSTLDGNNSGNATGDSSDSYQMTFYTSYFGDYDGNRLVNAADLGMFAWAWYQPTYYRMFEAGPLSGNWPHQRVYVGGATRIDFEDLAGFIYSWNRADNPKSAGSGGYQEGPVSLEAVPGEKLKLAARISPEVIFASMDAEIEYDPSLLNVKTLEASDIWRGEDRPQLFLSKQREGRTIISAAKWQAGQELSGELFSVAFEGNKTSQTPVTLSYRLYDGQGAEICSGNTALTLNAGPGIPGGFFLGRAAPNPTNRPMTINYQLPKQARVKLEVYNIAGQQVATLVDTDQPAGYYSQTWDLRDRGRTRVANGIYFYKLTAGEFQSVGKVVVIR